MSDLNAVQVQERLALDPQINAAGEVLCQICDRPFPRKASLGVHQIVHRREVGLAPPSATTANMGAAPKMTVCRWEGCKHFLKRTSLPSHLTGRHRLSRDEASFWARTRRDQDLAEQNKNIEVGVEAAKKAKGEPSRYIGPDGALAPPSTPAQVKAAQKRLRDAADSLSTNGDHPSVLTDITAVELVTGILRSARTDGQIPVKLLPAVFDLVRHTEEVLTELAKLSS